MRQLLVCALALLFGGCSAGAGHSSIPGSLAPVAANAAAATDHYTLLLRNGSPDRFNVENVVDTCLERVPGTQVLEAGATIERPIAIRGDCKQLVAFRLLFRSVAGIHCFGVWTKQNGGPWRLHPEDRLCQLETIQGDALRVDVKLYVDKRISSASQRDKRFARLR
jgi:hypothetical protein